MVLFGTDGWIDYGLIAWLSFYATGTGNVRCIGRKTGGRKTLVGVPLFIVRLSGHLNGDTTGTPQTATKILHQAFVIPTAAMFTM